MFPYLDISGFKARTSMPPGDVDYVEQDSPGYVASRIAVRSSYINGRLRKRYGNAGAGKNSLPLGQTSPALIASGSNAPAVTLQGRPTLGCYQMLLILTTGGGLGAAVSKWSSDGGITFTSGVTVAASVPLGATGMTATFPDDVYLTGQQYAAATPVPEIVLGWLTTLVTFDLYMRRGMNPQDPKLEALTEDVKRTYDEIKEAADSKDGLFDLPTSEDEDSAVTEGFVLGTSQQSPYVWTNDEANQGRSEDAASLTLLDFNTTVLP